MTNLLRRTLSAVVGIPLIVFLTYEGRALYLAGVVTLTAVGLFELRRMLLRMNLKITPFPFYCSGVLLPFVAYFAKEDVTFFALLAAITLVLLLHLTTLLATFPKSSVGDVASSYFGSCYLGLLFSFFIILRKINANGFSYTLLVFLLTWSCDIGAYLSGRIFGKNALCPKLSPHKTIEGAVGGLIICIASAILLQETYYSNLLSFWNSVVLGAVTGFAVQIGDLVESAFKRFGNVKDSGELIPGHGGVLDRFDSLLFSAPTAYFYIKFFL